MRIRPLLLVALLGLACRPLVEGEVPCAEGGDLVCPTGWHCDAASGLCAQGENAPTIAFTDEIPSGGLISGRVQLRFSVLSAPGIADVTLAAEGSSATVSLVPERVEGDGAHTGVWSAIFETWQLEDGPASIIAWVADDIGLSSSEVLNVTIANGKPVVTITSPAAGQNVGEAIEVTARVTSHVPLIAVEAWLGDHRFDLIDAVRWDNTDHLAGEIQATLAKDFVEDPGATETWTLKVDATDVMNTTGNATLDVEITDAG